MAQGKPNEARRGHQESTALIEHTLHPDRARGRQSALIAFG